MQSLDDKRLGQGLRRALARGRDRTIREVISAGLRDRDYENLATGIRMEAHAQPVGNEKRIVCDCVDVERGVNINRCLLSNSAASPIVEGALIAAFATGASSVTIHIAEDGDRGCEALESSASHLKIDRVRLEVVRGPFRRDMKGYEERPTLILTGETLLNLSRILTRGAEEYRMTGTPDSPGTKLFQVSGAVNRPGIFELPLGTGLRDLIEEVCGGVRAGDNLQAVIVGGAKGACFRPDELDLSLDFDTVRSSGGVIGSGAVDVLTQADCIIDQARQRIASSCYDECGMCSLGREGSYQLREMITDATRAKSKGNDLAMLREIGGAMQQGCACVSGRTAPNLILSTMEKFPEEYEAHMRRKRCQALVCERYVTFHILPDLCDGCCACADGCPGDAIEGEKKKIHVIDQESCEKCGKCYEVCNALRQAVVKAGAVKPRTPKRPIPVGTWNA